MFKLYNSQSDITTTLRNFLENHTSSLHKPQLNFVPEVIYGMIQSQSVVSQNVSLELKNQLSSVKLSSIQKRFSRLMKNPRYHGRNLFDEIVSYIIEHFSLKHNDKRVHIIIDHMYSKDNYTILMASMRLGSQGIPIYFKSFKGDHHSDAYLDSLLIEAIHHIHHLFKNTDAKLIFLADRWFNSYQLLNTIHSLGHTYVIRLKGNLNIKIFDKREKHKIRRKADDLFAYQFHSCYYQDIELYEEHHFSTNIIRTKKKGVKESWILATIGDLKRAIRDYSFRFGGIETIFKNQKSNGFYLEDVVNASSLYFENLYATMCIAILLLTCVGSDYSKNSKCYKKIPIDTHKRGTSKKVRVLSLFKTGLILFHIAVNSLKYIRLPLRFILYDI